LGVEIGRGHKQATDIGTIVKMSGGDQAPAPTLSGLGRGTSQSGGRLYNERLVLSLVRRHASLPKAEIARLTGLSAQTASVIVTQLEADGLLLKLDPQRGRIGQPSVPFALNPDGALAVGIKIGRRSTDFVLVDLVGQVRYRRRLTHAYPEPRKFLQFVRSELKAQGGIVRGQTRRRVAGIGIATPFELWSWQAELGAPAHAMRAWETFDTAAEVAELISWPVHICNDGTAACAAETLFGANGPLRDYLYVFIGSFVGGGIVLDGAVVQGRTGNAGAIGSLPIARIDEKGHIAANQLIRCASLYLLERRLKQLKRDPSDLWLKPDRWPNYGKPLDQWISTAAHGLAVLTASACAIVDFEAIVIDGAMPLDVRKRLVETVRDSLGWLDRRGLSPVEVLEGTIGHDARAIGGAALPILANFARDREVLFKGAGAA
jgi:predicted NBD/HSP70 family sugar kinase